MSDKRRKAFCHYAPISNSAGAESSLGMSQSSSGEIIFSPSLPSPATLLTYEEIPFGIQISLVRQAALHYVEAVVVTRFHSGQSSAVRAVQHLH